MNTLQIGHLPGIDPASVQWQDLPGLDLGPDHWLQVPALTPAQLQGRIDTAAGRSLRLVLGFSPGSASDIIAHALMPNPDIAAQRARVKELADAFPLYPGLVQ